MSWFQVMFKNRIRVEKYIIKIQVFVEMSLVLRKNACSGNQHDKAN